MKIYTSYFARLKSLPQNIVPIAICAKAPDWYRGVQYKKLAPNYRILTKWKENHDNDYYIKRFFSEVLNGLNQREVLQELNKLSDNRDIALICYEKSGDFCHRHLVASWGGDLDSCCIKEWRKPKSPI